MENVYEEETIQEVFKNAKSTKKFENPEDNDLEKDIIPYVNRVMDKIGKTLKKYQVHVHY